MPILLEALPYAKDALMPHISENTLNFHYGKHHNAYVEKLNSLIKGTELENESLERIIQKTSRDTSKSLLFNNAAQAWNHAFYWQSMKSKGGGVPAGAIADKIQKDFGNYGKFVEEFKSAGLSQFGSGWVWLLIKEGALTITKTANADTPIAYGMKPLLTVDVWEHAYYLDYQNRRGDYLDAYINHLINWEFVNTLLA
ncbi:MAG: superoxide dismutase [Candidatus Omnitrophota bacterium]